MARKIVSKNKAVVPNPDSISGDGYKVKPAAAKRKPAAAKRKPAAVKRKPAPKTGTVDFSSISIHEKVALLAYSYWEERGRQGGSPEEDWYRAEKEVLAHGFHRNA